MNQNKKFFSFPNVLLHFFLSCLFLTFFSTQRVDAQYQKTQKAVTQKIDAYVNGYYESLPEDYASNPAKKYPLLIFIHGVGELGNGSSQLSLVLKNGPPKLLNEGKFPSSFTVGGKNYSFIVISPQLISSNYSESPTIINDIINYCKQKYRVDEQRVYLTGLSMGGTMTWYYGGSSEANAKNIAASLVVCGNVSNSDTRVKNTANAKLPIWATVNTGDPLMSPSATSAAISAINAFVPTPPKALLSIFNASGHDAWTKTYDPNFKQDGLNVYEWMLSYSRGAATSSPDPLPPTANAGTNQSITLPTNSVTLDGSKSAAASGSIVSYTWTKVSGPAATITSSSSAKTTVTGLVAGTYQFSLTVKDSNGKSASATVSVTVNAEAVPLKSHAGSNQTITLPVNSVTVDGSTKSTYPTGSTFLWVKLYGPAGGTITTPTSLKTTITGLNNEGDYQFQLQIRDKNGTLSTSSMHVIVNAAPVTELKSHAGSNQTITLPVNSVTVDGSTKSTYPTGSTFLWVKLYGPAGGTITTPASLKTTITGLNNEGDYQFQLQIRDKNGTLSTSSMHVIVKSAPELINVPPLYADAGGNQTITLPVTQVKLDGSAKSTAPEGSVHIWKQTGGPVTANILYPYSIGTNVTGLTVAGIYKFQLVLTDPQGNVATSTTTITVTSAVSARTTGDSDVNVAVDQPLLSGNSDLISTSTALDVKIYPNPVQSDMNVWIESKETGKVNVVVYNYQGVSLFQRNFVKYTSGRELQSFNISKLPAGVYLLKVSIEDKYQQTVRIVKQ
ncbi:MAG: T9SS type A sorting domain-containing protein [Chitinophagaceae bacterium]|nr:T9SS type A sorting domain-containing protein [Chitinophagaceae bacterium]